jgi:hypothetical protein
MKGRSTGKLGFIVFFYSRDPHPFIVDILAVLMRNTYIGIISCVIILLSQ